MDSKRHTLWILSAIFDCRRAQDPIHTAFTQNMERGEPWSNRGGRFQLLTASPKRCGRLTNKLHPRAQKTKPAKTLRLLTAVRQ